MNPTPRKFCRHRGRFVAPRSWICTSPLVVAPAGLVTTEMCDEQCPYVDHLDDPRFSPTTIGSQVIPPSSASVAKYPQPQVLNCIYHVCPLPANDLWRMNVRQLVKRADIFNGQRIAAIATGDGLLPPREVYAAFEGSGFSFLEIPNDPWLREVATFRPLLEAVSQADPLQATFYAHTKGNSTAENVQGATYWRNAAYHYLLDGYQQAVELMRDYACVGIHKAVWSPTDRPPYPTALAVGQWMFAGTFFWFRNDLVFSHPEWTKIAPDRYGAEAWLSSLFTATQGFSVYQLWPEAMYPMPNPYDPGLYERPYEDEQVVAANPESVKPQREVGSCVS